jgi:hypothetical protein
MNNFIIIPSYLGPCLNFLCCVVHLNFSLLPIVESVIQHNWPNLSLSFLVLM